MNAMLVWLLFNATTGQVAFPVQFPTQVDCLRASNVLHQAQPRYQGYTCRSMTVVNPYGDVQGVANADDVHARVMRNYNSEQDHIRDLLSHPPHPVQSPEVQ